MFAAAGFHISIIEATAVLTTAIVVAGAIGAFSRRRFDELRDHQRTQDDVEGWVGANGERHVGIIAKVNGWTDESGLHEGCYDGVRRLNREAKSHRDNRSIHGGVR